MRFTRAIVRPPAATFAAGITTSGLGPPDPELARHQHHAYVQALERLGLAVTRLPPDPDFPDSTFVEDTAVVARAGAMLTRPGAPSRTGEVAGIREALRPWFPDPSEIAPPGTVDGGDVCQAGDHVFIGRSARTNEAGIMQLAAWLRAQGYAIGALDIRDVPGLLHLKTGVTWLGGRRLLAAEGIARHEALAGWEVVPVPPGEEYAANCVAVNGALLVPAGFPRTADRLGALRYHCLELDLSEFRKMDGGLSCLSVRW